MTKIEMRITADDRLEYRTVSDEGLSEWEDAGSLPPGPQGERGFNGKTGHGYPAGD